MSRLLNMIVRGVVRANRTTGGFFRELQMSLPADDPDDVQFFQPHGLESRPVAGAEGLVFAVSGNADHLVAIIAGSSTLDLAAGESAIKNEHGWSIQVKTESIDFVLNGVIRARIDSVNIFLGDPAGVLMPVARQGDPVATPAGAGTIGLSTSLVKA